VKRSSGERETCVRIQLLTVYWEWLISANAMENGGADVFSSRAARAGLT